MIVELNIIKDIVNRKPPTVVRPREFFIAWQGVPTIAYHGFSNILLQIKKEIKVKIPGLREENPGSLWPKTTLGSLKDDKTLSWEDAFKLRKICTDFNKKMQIDKTSFEINQLSIVSFQCRSLEKRLATNPIDLNGDSSKRDDSIPDYHKELVDQTMKPFEKGRLLDYLEDLKREGNRETDYRKDHIEATLVFDLPKKQPKYIQDFIDKVNSELPDLYCWFEPESRHMTVRALA